MASEIITVLGPVPVQQMGITLMHEHLFIDLCRVTCDPDHWPNDFNLTIKELNLFSIGGGRSVVDVTNTVVCAGTRWACATSSALPA